MLRKDQDEEALRRCLSLSIAIARSIKKMCCAFCHTTTSGSKVLTLPGTNLRDSRSAQLKQLSVVLCIKQRPSVDLNSRAGGVDWIGSGM